MIRSLAPLTIPLLLNACSLVHDDLPNDLRFSLHKDITALGGAQADLLRDPKVAKLVLEGL